MQYIYITKFVSKKDYDDYFVKNNIYAPLSDSKGGCRMGFLIAGSETPAGCQTALLSEAEQIKKWRKDNNIYPQD